MTRTRSFFRWARAPSVYAIAGLIVAGIVLTRWIASIGGPMVFADRYGAVAPFVTVPIHIVVAVTPIPSDAISIANGALYGFAVGSALSWLGWWVAAVLEFGLGRRARIDFDLQNHVRQLPGWLQRLPVDHPLFLIGARQIPWLGGHVTTFVPGAAGVAMGRFLWCSAIAIIPSSMLMAAIGAGLARLS